MNIRGLILLASGFAIIAPIVAAVAQGHFIIAILLVACAFLLLMFRRIDLWWAFAVMTVGSQVHIITPNAGINLLGMGMFVALGLMMWVMTQGRVGLELNPPRRAALILVIVVVITASIRGWGLRVLGSSSWGGMQYILVLASLLFYILSSRVTLTEDRMWRIAIGLCLLGLIPAVVAVGIRFFPTLQLLQYFVNIAGAEDPGAIGSSAPLQRFQVMQLPAVWAALLALLLYDRRFRLTPLVLVALLASFTMLGAAGHRTVVVLLGLMMLLYLGIRRKSVTLNQYATLILLTFAGIIFLYAFILKLPLTFQRAFAFLPGIRVSFAAATDAIATTEWRIEMWKLMIPMIPQYLLVGRGLGFDLSEAYAAYTLTSDYDLHTFFIATHNYHSGPLWLLVDLGLGGLLCGMAIMFGGMIYYGRRMHEIPEGTRWRTLYIAFYCFFGAYSIFFYTVIGSHGILPRIMVSASILDVILRSVRRQQALATVASPDGRENIPAWRNVWGRPDDAMPAPGLARAPASFTRFPRRDFGGPGRMPLS
jgi:hypothetical protein